jgi:DNA-binding SARP family transcriptional activator
MCFKLRRPFAVPTCRLRRKDGQWVAVTISTLVMPRETGIRPEGQAVAIVFLREDGLVPEQTQTVLPLRIYTLGRFSLSFGGHGLPIEKWKRKHALTLLKYLVTHQGRAVHRERLIECLWSEAEEGPGWERLRVTIYFLRRQLRAAGMTEPVVETAGQSYVLRRDAVWVDAAAFEVLIAEGLSLERRGRPNEALERYKAAQSLHRGDYLEEEPYADWCAEERERLREKYLELLASMAECHAALSHYAEAAQVCRTALMCDPCRESFQRALLEYFVRLGRVDWAEAQFRYWRKILKEELGTEPMPETLRLYRELVTQRSDTGRGGRNIAP